jgi:hypothetical protein
MHLSSVRKAFLACMAVTAATMTIHGSQPLRVLAWTPTPSSKVPCHATTTTTTTTSRRALFQALAGALVMTGSVAVENAVAAEVPTTKDINKGRTTYTKRNMSSSSLGDEDKDEMARNAMQENRARILAEKEAQRIADETKQRLAVGRIGTI